MAVLGGGSTATTGGLGNPLISASGTGRRIGASILSLLSTGLFLVAVLILAGAGVRIWMQRRARSPACQRTLGLIDSSSVDGSPHCLACERIITHQLAWE